MIRQALIEAALDRRLTRLALRVYVVLHTVIDDQRFRPVKRGQLTRRLQCHWVSVPAALRQLERCGYVKRGPLVGDAGRQVWSYRLTTPAPPQPSTGVAPPLPLPAA